MVRADYTLMIYIADLMSHYPLTNYQEYIFELVLVFALTLL